MSYRSEEERQVIYRVAEEFLSAERLQEYQLPAPFVSACWQAFENAEAILFKFNAENDPAENGQRGWRVSQADAHYVPLQSDMLDYFDMLADFGHSFVLAIKDTQIRNWHWHLLGMLRGQFGARCLDLIVQVDPKLYLSLETILREDAPAEGEVNSEPQGEAAAGVDVDTEPMNHGNGKALAASASGN